MPWHRENGYGESNSRLPHGITEQSSDEEIQVAVSSEFKEDFYKELDDDFNTPKAFAIMFDFINNTNKLLEQNLISKKDADEIYKFFVEINNIFGIIDFKKVNATIPAKIKQIVKERELARKNQNWQKSDDLRKEIERQGFTIEDTKSGAVIKRI